MGVEILVASESVLREVGGVPELVDIDREIGRPYIQRPRIYNSQAWSRKVELPWAIRRLGEPKGVRVLDVGSGFSPLPKYLARRGAKVVSLDLSRGLPPEAGIATIQGGLPRLPFRDSAFDVVTCISVLEHLPGCPLDSVAELLRVTKARLILTFDLATGPLALGGLSHPEVSALSRAFGHRGIEFPPDALSPSTGEVEICGRQLAVCLVKVEKTNGFSLDLRSPRRLRAAVRIHRAVQSGIRTLRLVVHASSRRRSTGREPVVPRFYDE